MLWSEQSLKFALQNHFGKLLRSLFERKLHPDIDRLEKSSVAELLSKDVAFLLDPQAMPNRQYQNPSNSGGWVWATPVFNAGSGGHHDIFMLAQESQNRGVNNSIGLINGQENISIVAAKKIASENYGYDSLHFEDLLNFKETENDLVIATGWQTFASAMQIPASRYAYLVQDFEPDFYAASTQRILAEKTYTKKVKCLTAGPWLAEKLRRDFSVDAEHFELGFSEEHYGLHQFKNERNAVVVYYREGTPRRASELMIEILKEASSKLNGFQIKFAGGSPRGKMPFEFEKLGRLNHDQLGGLYGQAAVTCVFSLTNTSLVPVEALACGSNLFTNATVANRLNLAGTNASLFDLDVEKMAQGLVA